MTRAGYRAVFAFALIVIMAALAGGAAKASAKAPAVHIAQDRMRLRTMALRSVDLPSGFAYVFSHLYGPKEIASQGTWTASELAQWGYEAGYEVQFDRGFDGASPAQISSDVGAYTTARGASEALAGNAAACQKGLWKELVLHAKIGSAAHLCTLMTSLRGYPAQVFFVVWRDGRFKGAITLTGIAGQVSATAALTLAERQQRRMLASE